MRRNSKDNEQLLYAVVSTQGGYFTSAQALAAGYSYPQQHYHTQHGTWLKVQYGIYRLRHYPPAEREDLIRLTLWSHNRSGEPQAVVSYETALVIHEMGDLMPFVIHLTVPKRGYRKEPPAGVVLHKDDLTCEDIELRHGYQVTTPLRTLLDVAHSPLSQEHLDKAVSDGLDKGLIRYRHLIDIDASSVVKNRFERAVMVYTKDRG